MPNKTLKWGELADIFDAPEGEPQAMRPSDKLALADVIIECLPEMDTQTKRGYAVGLLRMVYFDLLADDDTKVLTRTVKNNLHRVLRSMPDGK